MSCRDEVRCVYQEHSFRNYVHERLDEVGCKLGVHGRKWGTLNLGVLRTRAFVAYHAASSCGASTPCVRCVGRVHNDAQNIIATHHPTLFVIPRGILPLC